MTFWTDLMLWVNRLTNSEKLQEEPQQKKEAVLPDNVTSNNTEGVKQMKVALVVGHTKNSQGACNQACSICEWEFNDKLVKQIDNLVDVRCKTTVVYRDAYKALPGKVNNLNPDFVVCFHANAFSARCDFYISGK